MGITTPTPIQAQAIPQGLQGQDILGSAQTGTGKTMAYLIPLMSNLMKAERSTALVMAPTRELAAQIQEAARKLQGKNLSTVLLIGGDSMFKQLVALKKQPRLIIGTPGRIHDHLNRGTLRLTEARFLVLDEVDRMLDMGFSEALKKIAEFLPETRQTFMFSATMPPTIKKLSMTYLKDPQLICVGSTTQPTAKIKQEILHTSSSDKFSSLLKELNEREGSVIIFVKTKHGADRLAEKLSKQNHQATSIHGDLKQRQREAAIKEFRTLMKRIMVATDVAARGLDISHIKHVINYDLPQCPEDYIHRIGRTGRAGMEGHALSFVSPEDGQKWKRIHHLMETGEDDGSLTAPARSSRKRKSRPQGVSEFPRKTGGFKSEKAKFQKPSGPSRKTKDFKSEKAKPEAKKTFSKPKFAKPGETRNSSKQGKGASFSKQSEGRHKPKSTSFKRGVPKRGGGKRPSSFAGFWAA